MRITGGRARGIPIRSPKGDVTRPATDQMRERLFSSLGDRILGAQCLDLFAGTGAYGLESLSRGAASVTWVEKHPGTAKILRDNLRAALKASEADPSQFSTVVGDALKFDPGPAPRFDLVFCDPPYPVSEKLAPTLFARFVNWVDVGLLCFEMPARLELIAPGWSLRKRLGKGTGDSPIVGLYERES